MRSIGGISWLWLLGPLGGLWLCGCTSPQRGGSFADTATSNERMAAIVQAARDDDLSRVPDLVRQLPSSDIVVRWAAIETLRQLTGEDMGYRHDGPRSERMAAIDRWVEAIRAHRWGSDDNEPAFRADPADQPTTQEHSPQSSHIWKAANGAP